MKFLKPIFFFILVFISIYGFGQCAMCKAVVESEMESGGALAKGINNGIIYLMFIPYILIGGVGYFIYRHYQKNKTSSSQ
ncbi:MAG: hypothetical protein KDD29_02310 [Flavobacteriales bacterium]|nr:hypothetical protein [Flavobacteriales bacterium]MCB9336099.1 hypothetical protein [Flavobacteriales bacterium]